MYNLHAYSKMVADRVRMDAYRAALERVIRTGETTVLDIGAGTGIMAMLAATLGARQVHAIEPGAVIRVAEEMALANGLGAGIQFHEAESFDVELPERAEVIVSDLRGSLPTLGRHIPAIIDARERLLASGGVLIPQQDRMMAACVESESAYQAATEPWEGDAFGFDMTACRKRLCNCLIKHKAAPEELISEPKAWAVIDYRTTTTPNVEGAIEFSVSRAATLHGYQVWFDAELLDGIGFSNAPGEPDTIYGRCFLPLTEPVAVSAGAQVDAVLNAKLVGENYVWQWKTCIRDGAGVVIAEQKQSSFDGDVLSIEMLRRQEAGYVPELSEDGRIDLLILARMAESIELRDIAEELERVFPRRFSHWRQALGRVGEVSARYCR